VDSPGSSASTASPRHRQPPQEKVLSEGSGFSGGPQVPRGSVHQ
jgi:hypothetical protein